MNNATKKINITLKKHKFFYTIFFKSLIKKTKKYEFLLSFYDEVR